ncbi:MAG: hypothetical protein ACREL9_06160 [Gemmatimonadales bacterium]
MTARSAIGLAALVLLGGCGAGAATAGTETPTPSGRDETVVTSEELRGAADAPNLYEAVKRLRPQWLAGVDVVVYVSNRRYGGSEALRQLLPSTVASLRYFTPSAAQQRFGSGHPHGAIQVIMRGAR